MKKTKAGQSGTAAAAKKAIAVAALTAGQSRAGAARAAGVDRRTVTRWLRDPGFRNDIEAARGLAFFEAVGLLKGGADQAARTLVRLLSSKTDADARQAAKEILSFAFRGVEVLDIDVRITRLEKILEDREARSAMPS